MTIAQRSDVKISELVSSIERQELMLPKMQRRYVWRATRVRDLLDSLYRGYPSGSILVWDNYTPELSRAMDVEQTGQQYNGRKLLLDGQQRLTSLTAVLSGKTVSVRGRRKPIDILFNLDHPDSLTDFTEVEGDSPADEEEQDDTEGEEESIIEKLRNRTFVVASKSLAQLPNWVSVTEVFRNPEDGPLLQKLGITSFSDPRYNKFTARLRALRAIKDYSFTVNTIARNVSYEEVAEIFVRVNSLGVKLRGSDLALALITAKWPESLDTLEEFQEQCEEAYTTFDLGLLVRSMVVFATRQSRFLTVSSLSRATLEDGWKRARNGLQYAINFLQENVGINDESLLTSPLFYIVIAYYSALKEERLSKEEVQTLRYWTYIASARGRYSRGSNESYLDADLRAVERNDGCQQLLENLRQQMGRFAFDPADIAGRGINSGLFSLMFLALKAQGAKDWATNLGISTRLQGNQHRIEFHHIFPKALLRGRYEKQEINEIANLAFISSRTNQKIGKRSPAEYLQEFLQEKGPEALTAQCIPLDAKLHRLENFREFLQARRELIAGVVNNFVGPPRGN